MEVKQFIEENIENIKADLSKLVSYNSRNCDDALPFGATNRECLDAALNILGREGLKTTNLDYYCGYGEAGQGDKMIGIVAHLDIVPAGEGWDSDPFTMVEKDGVLYGRGVSDDKGAAICSLYAIKYLLQENYNFKKRVRLILGCNEETGSKCVEHYCEVDEHPTYAFTPDGEFPGIFAEKGMCRGNIVGHNSKIIDIKGGEATNIVCKKCIAKLPLNSFDENKLVDYLNKNEIKFDLVKEDVITLTTYGVAAHASTPDLGKNAFSYMMEALYNADFNDSFTTWFHNNFALTVHGEILGFEAIKDEYTDTSINFGVISKRGNDVVATLDMRCAVKTAPKVCNEMLQKANDAENEFELVGLVDPLFFDVNNPMIEALKKSYVDVTGDDKTQMMAIGGGTYAKEIPNCIAFGCAFLSDDDYHIHDANEHVPVASLKKQIEIYVEAIKNLNELEG